MRISLTLKATAISASIVFGVCPAVSQSVQYGPAPSGFCVFNRSIALGSSQAGLIATRQMQSLLDGIKTELLPQQQGVINDNRTLEAARNSIAAAQYQQRLQSLQQRAQALQQLAQLRDAQLARTRLVVEQQIGQALQPILIEVINARKCGIVLDSGGLVGANPNTDLTSTVIQGLNRRLPTVQVRLVTPDGVRQ